MVVPNQELLDSVALFGQVHAFHADINSHLAQGVMAHDEE
jgi:hypothetical protein